jgi:Tol biopolymer transport system component
MARLCRPFVLTGLACAVVVGLAFAACAEEEEATPVPSARIAFVSNRDGNEEVYVMKADGSGQTNLTNNVGDDSRPAWSPDGSKIAFVSDRGLCTMNADGSGQTDLPMEEPPGVFLTFAWSSDGSQVAVCRNSEGPGELYVISADGSAQTRLAGMGCQQPPTWSPDGSQIAWSTPDIYVINADGTGETKLTSSSLEGGADYGPAWSPAGSQIAFHSYPTATRDSNFEIYAMNADGSRLTNLTNNPGQDLWPVWSPDGSQIAFVSERDGNEEVYVMNADGTGQTNLTNSAGSDSSPVWAP